MTPDGQGKTYPITVTFTDGRTVSINACCERQAITEFRSMGGSGYLQQAPEMPRTCPRHSYPTTGEEE